MSIEVHKKPATVFLTSRRRWQEIKTSKVPWAARCLVKYAIND